MASFLDTVRSALGVERKPQTRTMGASTPATFDASVKLDGAQIKNATINQAPTRLENLERQLSINPYTNSRETGGYGHQVITMARNAPDAFSNFLGSSVPVNASLGGLDLKKTAEAAGSVIGGIPAVMPNVGMGLVESTTDFMNAEGAKNKFVKATSIPIKTFMPIMSLIPGVMAFQFGTQATGTNESMDKGMQSAKEGLARGFKSTGFFDDEQSKDLASNGIDGLQLGLSLFGGAKSSQVGGKAKVSEITRQSDIANTLKGIEQEAIKSGLNKVEARTLANEMRPVVSNAKPTSLLSDAQVISSNLKNIGIDIAANAVIPVLGMAYESYKNGEYDDFTKAISEAAIQTAAGVFPGVKALKTKTKPDVAQASLDINETPVKAETPTSSKKIVESKIDTAGTTTKKTTLPPIKTFSKLADVIGIAQEELYGEPFSKNEQLYRSDATDGIMRDLRDQRDFNTLRRIDLSLMPDDVRAAVEQYKIQGQPGVDSKLRQDAQKTKEANVDRAIDSGLFNQKDTPVTPETFGYNKNLRNMLKKSKFLDEVGDGNILGYDQFGEYDGKYYIANLIGGVAETSKATYDSLDAQSNHLDTVKVDTPTIEPVKATTPQKTILETVQENVGPEPIRALTTTEEPVPKTETSVDNIEYTDWEEVPRDDMQSNFGGEGGGNEPPTNGPKDVGFSDNPPDRDIQANEATDIIKGVVANNLPSNRSATLGKGPIASALRGALGRAYNFFVSSRLGGDTLMVEVDNSTPSKVNPETSTALSTQVADGSVPLGLPGSVPPIKATTGKKTKIPFTQFLDITRRGISGGIRNAITRSLKINEQYKPLADNAAELKPEYLIGKSFEDFNGGKVIDADDAAKIIETQKYSDAHTKHSSNAFDENQRKNIYQNSSVYRFVKDDPALASQIFSPEQLTSLKNLSDKNKGNQNSISIGLTLADDSGNKGKYMSKGVMINPDYERISMSYDNYKRFLKDTGLTDADVMTAVDTEGRTHTYNSALDFLSAYENKQKGVEFDPDQLASILKERGLDPKLDLYRDQGAAVSMDSFIDNVSRLVSNHETARMIDEAASSKDKTVSGYAKKLRSSSQFMEKALDVIPQRNAVEKGLDWVGKFVTPIRLAFNIKNYLQGTLTSGAQNLIGSTIARNKKGVLAGFSPVQIKEYNDPLVADTLYNNGFTERSNLEWEGIPDTWKGGVTKVSQVSAGAIQEHNGKAAVALREMENFLTENNIATNRSPKDISAKWNEYAEKNGNDPTFLKKKADIKMQTELIGDFGKMSRFTGMGIGRYTKDMKNWTTGQVSSFMRDMGNLGDGQARKRLAIQMTPWVIATATAYAALPESEDRLEKSLRIGSGISFPPFGIYQLVTGTLGSSTVSAIKDIISGGVKLGYISMQDFSGDINDDESNKLYGEQLSRFTDAFGADKGVNAIYSAFNIGKDSFTGENSTPYHEAKATSLGSPVDYKNVTGAGYHKGKDITRATEDLMSAFVDMDYINNQQNFENIDRYKNDPTYTNKEPSLTKGMNIFQKILLGTSTPVNDALYTLKESVLGGFADDSYTMEKSVQQRIDGMHVIDILNSIDKSNTIEDIMVRQDIPQEAKNEMIIAIESITTSMESTNVDTKNALPKDDTSIYTPKSSLTTNFRGYINELKDNNPYAYNRIIGGIAQLSKSINATNFNGLDAYEKEQKIKELVTSAINPKNTGEQYIDAVIADRNNTKSLTTSFVNKVVDTISDMAWKKDGKVASAEERLDLLNRLAGDVMTLSTNEYLVDSFSEAMTKLFTLENGRVKFLNGFFDKEAMKDKMNNILSFIYTGLGVRGEQKGELTIESLSETPAQSPQGAAGGPTINPASISSLLSGAGTGTKIQPLKIIQPKSQSGSGKIPSRGEAKSLAETLGIVKQQKSQPKIAQAKLATFSQK